MNCAQWLVRRLYDGGVRQVFVLCGNGLNPFLDACLDSKMRILDVRNEQAAAFMADLWGRGTGTLGVVAVSSGPGHTNALTGVANAHWDGGPLLLISGCSDSHLMGRDAFQEIDQVGMARPICNYAGYIGAAETFIPQVRTALSSALTPRPGPSHLTIPEDVFRADIDAPRDRAPLCVAPAGDPEDEGVEEAVEVLRDARRPIMVVGSGAFYAGAGPALRRWAGLTDIPVFSLLWDRGCVDSPLDQYVGVVSGEVNPASQVISKADVILTLGARVDFRLTYGEPPMVGKRARFIRVDADPREVHRGVRGNPGLVGDPRRFLEKAFERAGRGAWENRAWLESLRLRRSRKLAFWDHQARSNEMPVPSLRLCRELAPFVRDDVTFLLDGGNIGRWAHLLFSDRHPRWWFTCGASGAIGWGIGGGVAARLMRPDRPVLLLSGDGSAGFTLGDIQTAVRFATPFVAVVAHDSAWGIVADGQPKDRHAGCELGAIRYDRVAEALGARGVHIEDPREIGPAVRDAMADRLPTSRRPSGLRKTR